MAAVSGLNPNVDFATGAAAISAGVTDPGAAAGLAMAARSVGMLAHALERKARPAFGVRRQTAREHLEAVPTGWL
jgi:citrate synthase